MSKVPPHVYLIAAARKIDGWGAAKKLAIELASVGPDLVKCAMCGKKLPKNMKKGQRRLYAVDHIKPIVGTKERSPKLPNEPGCLSWDVWLDRLMFGKRQILCQKPCHEQKTRQEGEERRGFKKRNKI